MGQFSMWHGAMVLVWIVAVGWPLAKILGRLGFSGWWAVLAFIPLVNIVGLWVLATIDWPAAGRAEREAR